MPFARARNAPSGQEIRREGGDYPAYRTGRDGPQPRGEVWFHAITYHNYKVIYFYKA